MVDSCTDLNSVEKVSNDAVDFSLEDKKYLSITKKGSFKWSGFFEQLKKVIDDIVETQGKWTLPGGGSQQFESPELLIWWYTRLFFL